MSFSPSAPNSLEGERVDYNGANGEVHRRVAGLGGLLRLIKGKADGADVVDFLGAKLVSCDLVL